jgi:hypothetical protein
VHIPKSKPNKPVSEINFKVETIQRVEPPKIKNVRDFYNICITLEKS